MAAAYPPPAQSTFTGMPWESSMGSETMVRLESEGEPQMSKPLNDMLGISPTLFVNAETAIESPQEPHSIRSVRQWLRLS